MTAPGSRVAGAQSSPSLSPRSESRPRAARRLHGLGAAFAAALVLVAGAIATVVPSGPAHAQITVPSDWPLIPSGRGAASYSFRLLFVTSTTRDATATGIGTYNDFVKGRAAAGHTALGEISRDFRAVACTETVSAKSNTGTTGSGVEIYWLGGARVAATYSDFYDGTWLSRAGRNESGNSLSPNIVWTGCESDGDSHADWFLGNGSSTMTGSLTSGQSPLQNRVITPGVSAPLYALSPVLTVAAANVPDAPAAPTISNLTPNGFAANWTAPADNGSAITKYEYQVFRGLTRIDGSELSPDTRSHAIEVRNTSMTETLAVDVQVRARNANGWGLWSALTRVDIPATNPPGRPTITDARPVGPTSIQVTWDAPSDVGGGIESYWIEVQIAGGGSVPEGLARLRSSNPSFASQSYTYTGLEQNRDYEVRMRAADDDENGPWTGWRAVDTRNLEPATPDAPTVAAGRDTLTVNWTAPSSRLEIMDYDVQYRLVLDGVPDPWVDAGYDGTATATTITGLPSGFLHEVQVRATNAAATTQWSPSGRATTRANLPPVFTEGSTAARSFAENTPAGTAIGAPVAATDRDGDVLSYLLGGPDAGSFAIDAATGQLSTRAGVTYDYETGSRSYMVSIVALDGNGGADVIMVAVEMTNVQEVPGKPAAPTVTLTSSSSVRVSWEPPPTNPGPPILNYCVTLFHVQRGESMPTTYPSEEGIGVVEPCIFGPMDRSHEFIRLPSAAEYRAQVGARNADGDSARSDEVTVTTPSLPPVWLEAPATTRTLAENTPSRRKVGGIAAELRLSDPDTSIFSLTYSLGGDDADSFYVANGTTLEGGIAPFLFTESDVLYDYEAKDTYSVIVTVSDGTDTADLAVTVQLTDVDEPPRQPDPPVLTGGDRRIGVSWTAPDSSDRPPVDDYDVEYRREGESGWTAHAFTGTGTSTAIEGLDADTTYEVRVRATNDEGTGPWSEAATIGVPGQPDAPTFGNVTATGFQVRWQAPSDDGGSPITGYNLNHEEVGAASGTTVAAAGTTANLTNLAQNTRYRVRVQAVNVMGRGPWSGWASVLTGNNPPVFSGPGTLSVPENTTGAGTVSASDPDTEDSVTGFSISGGADAARFSITNAGALRFDSAPDYENPRGSPASATNTNTYEVEVRAASGLGDREMTASRTYSVQVTDVPAPGVPGAPALVSATLNTLAVEWTAAANAVAYDLEHREGTSGSWTDGPQEVSGTSATIPGLSEGTGYQVRVRARNDGVSGWAQSAGTLSTDSAPVFDDGSYGFDLAENADGSDQNNPVTVGTVRATDADGDAVTYSIAGVFDAGRKPIVGKFAIDPSSGVITYKDSGEDFESFAEGANRFELTVQATAGGVATDVTVTVTVTDVTERPDAPAAPTVTPTAGSTTSLDVSWNAPAWDGGAAVDDYDVEYRVKGPPAGEIQVHDQGIATAATIADLAPGTAYEVRVRAENTVNESDWTAWVTGTTAGTAPATPAAPTVTPTAGSETTSLDVSWTAPADGGVAISDYDLQFRLAGPPPGQIWVQVQGGGTTATIANLEPGTAYLVRVRAENLLGESDWSGYGSGTTLTVPLAPTDLAVTGTSALAVNLSWSAPAADPAARLAVTGYRVEELSLQGWLPVGTVGAGTLNYRIQYIHPFSPGAASSFRVIATSGGGDSLPSTALRVIPVPDEPDAPRPPTFTEVRSDRFTVNWTAPDDNGSAIIGYYVQYREVGATSSTDHSHAGTGTTTTITGLEPGTAYEVRVLAENNVGDGPWSDWATETTAGVAFGEASYAFDLAENATDVAVGTVSATHHDGEAVTYTIEAGDPDNEFAVAPGSGGAAITYVGGGEDFEDADSPARTFTLTVRATASPSGEFGDVTVSVAVTDVNEPPAFTGSNEFSLAENRFLIGAEVRATDPDSGDNVTFSKTGGADEDYFSITSAGALTINSAPNHEAPADANGDNVYEVTITATGGTGARAMSVERDYRLTVTDVPDAPEAMAAPTVTPAGTTSIAVRWTAPDADGEAITRYWVHYREYREDGTGSWTLHTQPGSATMTTIGSLMAVTAYEVRVLAFTRFGGGPWSAPGVGRTGGATFGEAIYAFDLAENAPGPVSVGTVSATHRNGETVAYAIAAGDTGSVFRIDPSSGAIAYAGEGEDFETVTHPAFTLTVRATADPSGEFGDATVTVNVTNVLEAPGVAGVPAFVSATKTTLTVEWTASETLGGPTPVLYDVEYREAAGGSWKPRRVRAGDALRVPGAGAGGSRGAAP